MFDQLDQVPWHRLAHCYGPATDAMQWIPALASEDEDLRSEAVYGFLHSSVCHQYTTYSATPHVIPFVIEALRDPVVSGRQVFAGGRDTMRASLFDFLHACAVGSRREDDVGRSLMTARDLYAAHVADDDPGTAGNAQALLRFCDGLPAAG